MNEQKIIYQVNNLINNLDLKQEEKINLEKFFLHTPQKDQLRFYVILIKNPEFIHKIIKFISQEKQAIENNDRKKLMKIFNEELAEVKKYI